MLCSAAILITIDDHNLYENCIDTQSYYLKYVSIDHSIVRITKDIRMSISNIQFINHLMS